MAKQRLSELHNHKAHQEAALMRVERLRFRDLLEQEGDAEAALDKIRLKILDEWRKTPIAFEGEAV